MKRPPDPGHLEKERERLIGHIHAAFADVSREGGVSWSEAGVLDDDGTAEACARARASDADRRWSELVDDPAWDPDALWGGFSFLDPIGFASYLPAAMVRSVRAGRDVGFLAYHLRLPAEPFNFDFTTPGRLDRKQRSCVARFLRFMIAAAESPEGLGVVEADLWRRALRSGWERV